uniref:histidine--tRNA ligase n=1 Tax=Hildenbrandia rubra TaxID=31481 RepID=A0A1C9CG88_9FLOR|nr:histidine-tRNA synthetase [Hildenbrandia rubra]AOM67391.1 histidine-tRNA synthetase [Hildenbrandia rubra]
MQKIRGTRDILYDELKYWRLIINKAKRIFEQAKYLEIYTPIIENTDLFTKSIGEETDIISKEMYSFQDQSSRNITLRPEGTASVVRALIENKLDTLNPINRVWYCGPMFRYERPQTGRQRQFYQLGLECFGSNNPRADAEVIYLAVKLLKQLSCKSLILEINSIGTSLSRFKYQEKLKNYLLHYVSDLDNDSIKRLYTNPLRILDSKDINTQKILLDAPRLYSFLDLRAKKHFEKVCKYLNLLQIPYLINNNLVRGLDYYNNTAFEIKTDIINPKLQNTICGGGRYDNLVYQLGGNKVPAVGCAIGMERLYSLLQDTISFCTSSIDIYIASQGNNANKYSLFVMQLLQARQFTVTLDLSSKSFKKQLKKAHKGHASVCFIIGEKEMLSRTITVKWLQSGIQEIFKQESLQFYTQYLKNKINNDI